jgi:rhodanese-related sulfurtransferase
VLVKGFAAFAEHHGQPRAIPPDDLKAALDAGEDWVVLDSRPPDEYAKMSIPGANDAPGPDLLRCFHDLVPSPTTKVAVNCATRTRAILGALSLRDAGVPNEVFFPRDGARGWRLRGFDLTHGATRLAPRPTAAAPGVRQVPYSAAADRAGSAGRVSSAVRTIASARARSSPSST